MLMYKERPVQSMLRQRQGTKQDLMQRTAVRNINSELKQKRKLTIYKKDDKYYVEHSVAYALNLTSVRAIMTGTPHLIEIGIETLNRLKSDDSIEIEYHNLDKNKESQLSDNDLSKELAGLEQGQYGIGAHSIDMINSEEKAESIINNGLDLNNNSRTILSTSISFGTNEDIQTISQEIENYRLGTETKIKVVIAVPLCIQNAKGEKIFLGFPERNLKTAGQQYEEHCILDRICSKSRKIPSQFILGYYGQNANGSEFFIRNNQHYSTLNVEAKEALFNECASNMDDSSKTFNTLIANGNIERLRELKQRMESMGWKSFIMDNAIELAQKQQAQRLSNPRRTIITTPKEQNIEPVRKQNVRAIILEKPDEVWQEKRNKFQGTSAFRKMFNELQGKQPNLTMDPKDMSSGGKTM